MPHSLLFFISLFDFVFHTSTRSSLFLFKPVCVLTDTRTSFLSLQKGQAAEAVLFLGWSDLVRALAWVTHCHMKPLTRILILDLPQDQGKHQVGSHWSLAHAHTFTHAHTRTHTHSRKKVCHTLGCYVTGSLWVQSLTNESLRPAWEAELSGSSVKNLLIQIRSRFLLQTAPSFSPFYVPHIVNSPYASVVNLSIRPFLVCMCINWVGVCPYLCLYICIFCSYAGPTPVCSAMDGSFGRPSHCHHHAPGTGHPSPGHHHNTEAHFLCRLGAYALPPGGLQCESLSSNLQPEGITTGSCVVGLLVFQYTCRKMIPRPHQVHWVYWVESEI